MANPGFCDVDISVKNPPFLSISSGWERVNFYTWYGDGSNLARLFFWQMGQGPADRYVHWTLEGIAKDDPLTENGNVLLTC